MNVGYGPRSVAVNPQTNTIYVANLDSNTLSLIDAQSNKILLPSKVTLNVSPPNAGKINCGYSNLPEPDDIVTNQPIRLLLESNCIAEANQGYKFSNWVENLGLNSTKTITSSSYVESPMENFFNVLGLKSSDSASNFTVTHGGSYTANFNDIPSPIPKEYLIGLYTIVVTTIIGLAIPSIVAWIKSKGEIRRLNQYHKKINLLYEDGNLDENDNEAMDILRNGISNAYAKGKINAEHYSNLKDEISILYHEVFNKRIESLDKLSNNEEKQKSMNQINEHISDAYAKGKVNELHYNLLKGNISEKTEYKK